MQRVMQGTGAWGFSGLGWVIGCEGSWVICHSLATLNGVESSCLAGGSSDRAYSLDKGAQSWERETDLSGMNIPHKGDAKREGALWARGLGLGLSSDV